MTPLLLVVNIAPLLSILLAALLCPATKGVTTCPQTNIRNVSCVHSHVLYFSKTVGMQQSCLFLHHRIEPINPDLFEVKGAATDMSVPTHCYAGRA